MPYTAYCAALAHGIIFGSTEGLLLFVGLLLNEALNHLLKFIVSKIVGKNEITKRPAGARDTGIYPQHLPKESTSMGMPSGHAQTSTFLATILLQHVFLRSQLGPAAKSRAASFIVIVAALVIISRTKYGGILCVHVSGKIVACHTVLQVVVGGMIGAAVGMVSFQSYTA